MRRMKKGIALLELIFSIVIIAIALVSVPNLIQTTTKATNKVITQESISNAASYANKIMAAFWDENCTDPSYENPILYVQNQHSNLQELKVSGIFIGRRVGSPKETSRRFRNGPTGVRLTASQKLQKEPGETVPDDIDDYNGTVSTLNFVDNSTASINDYKDTQVYLSTTVDYLNDNVTNYDQSTVTFNQPFNEAKINKSQTTNIKLITITLTSLQDNDKKVVLKAFSCNIGSSKLRERLLF